MSMLQFSPKQRRVLTWWLPGGRDEGMDALVCEDVALQVVEALATIYGTYKIQHCSFDRQTSLFHSTVLVTFRQAHAE